VYHQNPESGSPIRKIAGSGSAENQCRSATLAIKQFLIFPKSFFSICILKNVPNFEVYSYSGNVVATETVVREPKYNLKLIKEWQKII
jgi:hypothetical protein